MRALKKARKKKKKKRSKRKKNSAQASYKMESWFLVSLGVIAVLYGLKKWTAQEDGNADDDTTEEQQIEEPAFISGTRQKGPAPLPENLKDILKDYNVTEYEVPADYFCWLHCLSQASLAHILDSDENYEGFLASLDQFKEELKGNTPSADWQLSGEEEETVQKGKSMLERLKNEEGSVKELDPGLTILLPFFKLLVIRTAEYDLMERYRRIIDSSKNVSSIIEKMPDELMKINEFVDDYQQKKFAKVKTASYGTSQYDIQYNLFIQNYDIHLKNDIKKASEEFLNDLKKHISLFKSHMKEAKHVYFMKKISKSNQLLLDILVSKGKLVESVCKIDGMKIREAKNYCKKNIGEDLIPEGDIIKIMYWNNADIGGGDTYTQIFLKLKKGEKRAGNIFYERPFYEKFGIQTFSIDNVRPNRNYPEELKEALQAKQSKRIFYLNKPFSDETDHQTILLVEDKVAR